MPNIKGTMFGASDVHKSLLFIHGGLNFKEKCQDFIQFFDFESMTWFYSHQSTNVFRYYHSLTALDECNLILFGGLNERDEVCNDIYHIKYIKDKEKPKSRMTF